MALRKAFGWFAFGLSTLYAGQAFTVIFWELSPLERREVQGVLYEIRRGWGFPLGLVPILGVSPVFGDEPVRLVTTDLASGLRIEKGYDVAQDIYLAYPAIWSEMK